MGLFTKKQDDTIEDKKKPAGKAAAKKTTKTEVTAKKETEAKEEVSMQELYGGSDVKAVKTVNEKGKKQTRRYGNAHRILVKPLITEKAANLGVQNKYVFEVNIDANKIDVAKAIEEVYGIKPVSVNMINNKGKNVRYGRKTGTRKDWRKAIVMLPKGKSINIYEGV